MYFLVFVGFLCCSTKPVLSQEEFNPDRVWSVKIEGNETFEGIVIKNVISNEPPAPVKKLIFWKKPGMVFNENEVRRDVIRIRRFYQRRGFNDVAVSYRIEEQAKEWRKTIVFEIIENAPIRIENVNFVVSSTSQDSAVIYNDNRFISLKERLPYRTGNRYETVNQSTVEGNLVGALRNIGYPFASSEVQAQIDTAAKTADVTLISYPGPRARFDSILVEGTENLDPHIIERETGIQRNDFFSENRLREAQREVFNHHMLRFAILSIPEQPLDSLVNIKIRVKEAPLRSVQVGFGAGNLTRIEGIDEFYKLFRGGVSWTHRNVRGKAERFTISGNASAIEQRLSADYLFPYLFNTKSSIILSPFFAHNLEPSYEIVRGGMTNSFVYQYSSNLTGTVSYQFSLNNESTKSSRESLPDSIQAYNISSFNLNAFYSRGLRRGVRGWSFQPFWELSGLFGESTYSFQKAGIDTRKFTSLTNSIVFAKRFNFSGIYYAKQDSLPSDIRIYNGGTNSVRGWNRRELGPKRPIFDDDGAFLNYVPIGGRATISFNTEFRFRLNQLIRGLEVATFLDGGQVWQSFMDIGTSPILFGTGGGLRYQSPIGPIRVDIAYKINPTDQDLRIYEGENYGSKWDHWGIHFSIGQAF